MAAFRFRSFLLFGLGISIVPLHADMAVTPAGTTLGFTLSTFADGFPNTGTGGIGPVGITFEASGAVMVSEYPAGKVVVFATDTDGQHYAGGVPSSSSYAGDSAAGLATLGGNYYMALQVTAQLEQVDGNGNAITAITANGTIPGATGVIADSAGPFAGDLLVSGLGNGIYAVNPTTHTINHFSTVGVDGITLSPDGSTVYAADLNGHLVAVSTTTGLITHDFGAVGSGIDGTVLGAGPLAGYFREHKWRPDHRSEPDHQCADDHSHWWIAGRPGESRS